MYVFHTLKTICRFRKYFLQVLLSLPRLLLGKDLLRGWEERAAANTDVSAAPAAPAANGNTAHSCQTPQPHQLVAVFHKGQSRLVLASPAAIRRSKSFAVTAAAVRDDSTNSTRTKVCRLSSGDGKKITVGGGAPVKAFFHQEKVHIFFAHFGRKKVRAFGKSISFACQSENCLLARKRSMVYPKVFCLFFQNKFLDFFSNIFHPANLLVPTYLPSLLSDFLA